MLEYNYMKKNSKGFTMIELLVTISVIGLLSGAVLLYSRKSEKIIDLNREIYDMVDNFSKVRSRSLGAKFFSKDKKVCGWGIYIPDIPANNYIIYVDLVDKEKSCRDSDLVYSGDSSGEKVERKLLENDVFITSKSFSNVLFIPPNPDVAIDGVTTTENGILSVKAGNYQRDLKVSKSGQITFSKAK